MDVAVCTHPLQGHLGMPALHTGTSVWAEPVPGSTCVSVCGFAHSCGFAHASVAGEHPRPLCGHMSLCWMVSTKVVSPGLPSGARGPFSPKEKRQCLVTLFRVMLLHLSLWDKRCNKPERSRHVKDQLSFTLSSWTLLLMPEQD